MPVTTALNELASKESAASLTTAFTATRFCYGTLMPESRLRICLPPGVVNFPMSTQDADRLQAAGENVPFGKGSRSVLTVN